VPRSKNRVGLYLFPPYGPSWPVKRVKPTYIFSIFFLEMSDEAIMGLNLPTGIPFVYELDENLKPVVSMQFLGDPETVKKAMEAVAAQGKAK
jgi:hypothetical protein